ncbi:hypothetical protein ACFXP3_20165 [Streptomyces sp. NPDC059096]|uniref:hypothetical protein n=1 Tax=Streptomyces sp. NPDC059096 TaxID=3346727 RepID=UPI0036A00F8C
MTATPAPRSTGRPTALARDEAGPGDGLVRAGAIVFIVGAVATLATVTPLFLGSDPFPTIAYAVSMLMGVGFAVAGAGVLRSVAAQRSRDKGQEQGQGQNQG